jgi:NTE family protein
MYLEENWCIVIDMNKIIIALFLCLLQQAKAQPPKIENIIFEGAGIRGLAFCGAIKVLEDNGSLQQVKRFGGTSAGAITALLLCLNYTAQEIENIIKSTNYRKFNDGGVPLFGGIHRLRKHYGWYKGKRFEKWLTKLIGQKTGNANITFGELVQRYKALYVTGTSLNEQKLILFSAEQFPAMRVKDAVRISMSIPLYYQAVLMDYEGHIYKKQNAQKPLHVMVDGGLMDNFPIQIFDSSKYMDATLPNMPQVNPYTIGCRIDNKNQIALDQSKDNNKELAKINIKSIGNYFSAFFVLTIERLSRQKLTAQDWDRSISIDDAGINPKVKKMPQKSITALVTNGAAATEKFLKK